MAIYVPIVMYCLRLCIIVLRELYCLPNCLHVCMIRVRGYYHITKFCYSIPSGLAKYSCSTRTGGEGGGGQLPPLFPGKAITFNTGGVYIRTRNTFPSPREARESPAFSHSPLVRDVALASSEALQRQLFFR